MIHSEGKRHSSVLEQWTGLPTGSLRTAQLPTASETRARLAIDKHSLCRSSTRASAGSVRDQDASAEKRVRVFQKRGRSSRSDSDNSSTHNHKAARSSGLKLGLRGATLGQLPPDSRLQLFSQP